VATSLDSNLNSTVTKLPKPKKILSNALGFEDEIQKPTY